MLTNRDYNKWLSKEEQGSKCELQMTITRVPEAICSLGVYIDRNYL